MLCVHCGTPLGADIGGGLYIHSNNRQRCQSDLVPYGHMGHPEMPCPRKEADPNPCSGSREDKCLHLHVPESPDSERTGEQ